MEFDRIFKQYFLVYLGNKDFLISYIVCFTPIGRLLFFFASYPTGLKYNWTRGLVKPFGAFRTKSARLTYRHIYYVVQQW